MCCILGCVDPKPGPSLRPKVSPSFKMSDFLKVTSRSAVKMGFNPTSAAPKPPSFTLYHSVVLMLCEPKAGSSAELWTQQTMRGSQLWSIGAHDFSYLRTGRGPAWKQNGTGGCGGWDTPVKQVQRASGCPAQRRQCKKCTRDQATAPRAICVEKKVPVISSQSVSNHPPGEELTAQLKG